MIVKITYNCKLKSFLIVHFDQKNIRIFVYPREVLLLNPLQGIISEIKFVQNNKIVFTN